MIDHADLWRTASADIVREQTETRLRSAISALYYSVFHRLTAEGASIFSGGNAQLAAAVARAFNHAQMAKLCEAYQRPPQTKSSSPLDLLMPVRNPDLLEVSREFVVLQSARHRADYDVTSTVTFDDAAEAWRSAANAHACWLRATASPDTTIFLTALLLHDRWTRRG